jgi:uncharacterized protein (DUF58 family)
MTKRTIDLEQIREFSNIGLLAKTLVEGFIVGLHRSPFHGFSVEFAEHRPYNTGESTRHIDWKVYAKTDRLYTKRYDEETNLRAYLVLDVSSSMYYPLPHFDKLTFSVMAAASLAYLLHKQRDAFSLCTFDRQLLYQSELKSTATHLWQQLEQLQSLLQSKRPPLSGTTAAAPVLHTLADKAGKRALFIIFSDMLEHSRQVEDIFQALQHLRHNRHEVLLFHVLDHRTEASLDFPDQEQEFIDLESGMRLRLNPQEVRQQYRRQMQRYLRALKLRCGQYGIDFVEADVRMPFEQILKSYLMKRNKMV